MKHHRNVAPDAEKEYFESFVDFVPESGCWLWSGPTNVMADERGRVMIRGKRDLAHRWAYRIYKGEIPDGSIVCHTCDVRICVNPDHLYAGTYQDNANDRDMRGRSKAKLSIGDVRAIRRSNEKGSVLAERYNVSRSLITMVRRHYAGMWEEDRYSA
jgi:hypothetical protein